MSFLCNTKFDPTIPMDFLFHTSVPLRGKSFQYDVYEFKLAAGKYKAEISSDCREHFNAIRQVIFWKDCDTWKTEGNHNLGIAEILGRRIDLYKIKGQLP